MAQSRGQRQPPEASHHVPVPGATIFAVEVGDRGRTPLVLFNGAYCVLAMWTPVLDRLTTSFHVIRHDYRGTGRSTAESMLDGYTLDRYGRDAAAVMDALGAETAVAWGMASAPAPRWRSQRRMATA